MVYAIAFNNPYGDKIITGSFDKTCKLWSAETGVLFHTFRGHATEIVCLAFNPQGDEITKPSTYNGYVIIVQIIFILLSMSSLKSYLSNQPKQVYT